MKIIDKIVLFKEATSKVDLIGNRNTIATLDSCALDVKVKYNIDSGHMCYITLDVDLLGGLVNSIPERGIIKTHAQNEYDYWVIVNIYKDSNLSTVELTCRHWVTEALRSIFTIDSKPRTLNGLAMLDWIKDNSEEYKQGRQYARDLEIDSNLSDLKSINAWHDNFYNVVSDLQELYGCEIKKSGFKIELVDYVGSKTSKYKIEYGKNLISNESQEDLTIIKGVLAKGYDKLYANNIIYSGKLSGNHNMLGETVEKTYPIRMREEGKEDEEGYTYYNTEAEAKAELERLARLEFTVNKIDEPKLTFDTEFLELSTVEEHKDDVKTWLSIGDKVSTYIPQFNIDIETRIVEMEVDVLADEVTTITLSNNDIKDLKPPTLNTVKQEIQKLPSIQEVLSIAKNESLNTVMNGFGGYAYYAPNFSVWTDSKDIKTAKKGLLANKNGWFFFNNGINIATGEANGVTMIADINGNFNAGVINTGTLKADLIKTGLLKSFNGKSWLNMENGTFNFADKVRFDGTNFNVDLSNQDVVTSSQAKSLVDVSSNSILAHVSNSSKLIGKNVITNGDFGGTTGSPTINGWNKNTIGGSASAFTTDGTTWCNFYATSPSGELFGYQDVTVEVGKTYQFYCKIAKYSTAAQPYLIRLQENISGTWTTKNEFSGNVDVDRTKPLVLYNKIKPTTTIVRIWIGKVDGVKFDIYTTDFQLYYGSDFARSSEIKVLDDKITSTVTSINDTKDSLQSQINQTSSQISSKVSKSDFGTTLEQNAYSVKIAWNKITNYVQFENGGLAIYNGSVNSNEKRAFFDERGSHFWRDGYYLGKIGTNQYNSDTYKKGITFDLEYMGSYMTWAVRKTEASSTYSMVWTYANKDLDTSYRSGKLHAGCDIDMHYNTLRNVAFEGGGINGTMNFVQVTSVDSTGTVQTWVNNCKMVFQNGILINATFNS